MYLCIVIVECWAQVLKEKTLIVGVFKWKKKGQLTHYFVWPVGCQQPCQQSCNCS